MFDDRMLFLFVSKQNHEERKEEQYPAAREGRSAWHDVGWLW